MKPRHPTLLLLLSMAGHIQGGEAAAEERMKSPIKQDETVTLFTTAAWPSAAQAGAWEVEIHGVIFEEQQRPVLSATFVKALGLKPESLTEAQRGILRRRMALFMVDNERGKSLTVRAGESLHLMPETEPNGHFRQTITLAGDAMIAWKRDGLLPLCAVTRPGDDRRFAGCACVLPDGTEPLVISDVDDTIKITCVRNHAEARLNTLCRPFQSVPGMAALYRKWLLNNGAGFCYVTGSPWQLYRPLEEFRNEQQFPAGAWQMKYLRFADPETVRAFFAGQTAYKLPAIELLLARWPHRPVVLAGDSGEQDPEIYATLAHRHPRRIARIFIRDVTGETRDAERYRKAFDGVAGEKWQLFRDAAELPERLPLFTDRKAGRDRSASASPLPRRR